jgi:methyl acetate hydrolase
MDEPLSIDRPHENNEPPLPLVVVSGVDSGAMKSHKLVLALTSIALAVSLRSIGLAQISAHRSSGASGAEHTQARGFSDAGQAALSRQLSDAVAHGDTPGVVALVVGPDAVLYEGAAGELDIARNVAMPVNAIFNIASMTKPITSVAVMMLFEEGKFKLDDPVSKYLPGFDHLQVITKFNEQDATYETRPAKGPITIRHLLTHTSGIGYAFTSPIEYRLTQATKKNEWELPLLSDPGTEWHYSASTRVLGMLVEKITGQSLEAYYQERIFKPLGMVDTSYAVPAAKQSRVPIQYSRINAHLQELPQTSIPSTPTAPFRGDGGLYSTAQDYGRFVQMILNGGHLGGAKILSESSIKLMSENNIGSIFVEQQPDADKQRTRPFPLGAGHDKFGLGFQIASHDPHYARYRSPGSLSWAGIYNTEFWIDPLKHIGAVQMMQMLPFYDDGAIRTLRDFELLVYQNLP